MKTKTLSFLAMAVFAFVGCSKEGDSSSGGLLFGGLSDEEKIATYRKGDWLHDIDEAKRISAELEDDPKYHTADWQMKAENLATAMKKITGSFLSRPSDVRECWPEGKLQEVVTTANTNHDCLDKLGYKRSR
jgi:hypothetical protein